MIQYVETHVQWGDAWKEVREVVTYNILAGIRQRHSTLRKSTASKIVKYNVFRGHEPEA
jgi:hypothetical protein